MKQALGLWLALSMLVAACAEPAEEQRAPIVRPAKLFTVQASSNRFPVNYPAVIEAAQSSVLTFQVGGLLQELPVVESQAVARGDLIARLDDRDFRSAVNSARTQFETADADYQRGLQLFERGTIAQAMLDQRRTARDVARAAYDTARKALEDSELRAPFDGIIAEVSTENFQSIAPGQPIVVLQSSGAVDAVINVPARLLAFIPQIEPVDPTITLNAAPDAPIPAMFKESAAQADPTTQTYRVRFSFTPPDNLLILPGMTGSVSSTFVYTGEDLDLGVSIPASAVVVDGEERFVWLVDTAANTVSRQPITLAPERFSDTLAVVEGLEGGETIVAAGAAYLQDGMEIRPWTRD